MYFRNLICHDSNGISVLIFSAKGKGRSAAACCAYLMTKFNWGFEKSYMYLQSKKADIALNHGFVQQLYSLERRQLLRRCNRNINHQSKIDLIRMKDWDTSYISLLREKVIPNSPLEALLDEELMLVISYKNNE